jgi:succinate-semialdehyde dehydrogenase / glutarate-semialdehyde dehydrogenase
MPDDHRQARYQSINPATGEVLAGFNFESDQAIEDALGAGATAFDHWSRIALEQRASAALRVAESLTKQADELAHIAVEEMGKPLAEALEEIKFCAAIFRYYGVHGPSLASDQPIDTLTGDEAVVQKRPIGLLLGVMPWNFPYYQVARFVAPNIVLGNTVLLKHAESVPRCALALQDLFREARLPDGVYQNLFATYAQTEQVIGDRRVQGVSLTGSERAGAAVAEIAGRNLKKCVLELGGSDPYVVLDSDDVPRAAKQAWLTRLYNTGQACNSNKRMIVMDDLYGEFVDELVNLADKMSPGDPAHMAPDEFAPLSSRDAAKTLAEQLDDAVTQGAKLHTGGVLSQAPSAYFTPAVLTDVTPSMRAFHEELFGPVAVVYRVSSEAEALTLANGSNYGLGGAVFSSDNERALRVASALEVGMANVNIPAGEGAEIPFGGVKRSGFGRELGALGMDEFANKRLLYVKQPPRMRRD